MNAKLYIQIVLSRALLERPPLKIIPCPVCKMPLRCEHRPEKPEPEFDPASLGF